MAAVNYPPGPEGHFLIGSYPEFRVDPLAFLEQAASYGDTSHFRMAKFHAYLINHPDLIHEVLVAHPEHYHKSRILKRSTKHTIGNGLLTSEDGFHKRQRRMIQPAFHHQRIAGYAEIMTRHTAHMLDTWRDGQQLDIPQQMMRLTLQIVSEALFGATLSSGDVSSETDRIGAAITLGIESVGGQIRSPIQVPLWLPTRVNAERHAAATYIRRTIMGIIEARQNARNLHERADLLSMLLSAMDDETSAAMSVQQVYDEAITLFIAGHETTALALSWTLTLLAQHRDAEIALRNEIARVLGDRPPTVEDLTKLKLVEYTIKEAMRLYPPAWVISRLAQHDVQLGGFTIPKGAGVLVSPWVTQRDPRWFDDPLAFRPERFGPDDSGLELEKRIPHYAYLPFGGGPRYCIGQPFAMMEMQIALPMILQRAAFSLLPGQSIEPDPLVTLRPKYGIQAVAYILEEERLKLAA
jgi:cytochrome P450